MLSRTPRRPVVRALSSARTKSGGGAPAAGTLSPADSTTAEMSCQSASILADRPASASASSVASSAAGPGPVAASSAARRRMRSRSDWSLWSIRSRTVPALTFVVAALGRARQADAQLQRDRREQLTGLLGVHRPDAIEQVRARLRLAIALAGQHLRRVITACGPELSRGQAGYRGHSRDCGRGPAYLGIDAGAHNLIAAGDLAPAPLAQPGPPGRLARRNAFAGQASCNKRAPGGRLRTFSHAATFA